MARPGLPAAERAALVALVTRMAETEQWKELVASRKWQAAFLPADEFAAFLRSERSRMKAALRATGVLKPDPN